MSFAAKACRTIYRAFEQTTARTGTIAAMKQHAYRLNRSSVAIAGSPLPPPLISYLGGGRWRLEATYRYRAGTTVITVPAGFEFDLASVPRLLWTLIAPFELSIVAPLLHDFLYRNGGSLPAGAIEPRRTFTRAQADRLFLDLMGVENVPAWRRVPAYLAVRLFGGHAWRREDP